MNLRGRTAGDWDTKNNKAAEAGGAGGARRDEWLELHNEAYRSSTTFMDTNLRKQWETNIKNWQSRHPAGSKYLSQDYRHRSKLFVPKTRGSVRRFEAAVAAAFFTTDDVVSIVPQDADDPQQVASARINNALMNYRLTSTIPWFLTLVGGAQQTRVQGAVLSKQYWEYQEKVTETQEFVPQLDAAGNPVMAPGGVPVGSMETRVETEVLLDRPQIKLFPIENCRIDPAADWTDPIESTPYLIVVHPMFVGDVKARMRTPRGKTGEPEWLVAADGVIALARRNDEADSTRQVRERARRSMRDTRITEFDVVLAHEVFLRIDGEDWVFWTLGEAHRLSDPKPVREVYRAQGKRPYRLGYGLLEVHNAFPVAPVELTADLQKQVNEQTNQRIDNGRYIMNGRYFVRRGNSVDLPSLARSRPGGITLMNNPREDVVHDRPPELPASAFAEQDRVDVMFDELSGVFSQSSVMMNRRLNETVGGMNLLAADSNQVTDYDLRVLVETWIEPVLRDLVLLEQAYETDQTILALAGKEAQLQRFGVDAITDELLQASLTVRVNVGLGSTEPTRKMQRFAMGVKTIGDFIGPKAASRLNEDEVIKEVMGLAGYKDGRRFFRATEDPVQQQIEGMLGEMQSKLDALQSGDETKRALAEMASKTQIEMTRMRVAAQILLAQMEDASSGQPDGQETLTDAKTALQLARLLLDRDQHASDDAFRNRELGARTNLDIARLLLQRERDTRNAGQAWLTRGPGNGAA